MQSSEVEDQVWPDVTAGAVSSAVKSTSGRLSRRWSPLWWGLSCVLHLLLLVAVGVLTRNIVDVPQVTPIRVSIVPTMATSAQSSLPESRLPERRPPDTAALSPAAPVDPDPIPSVTPRPPLPTPLEPERPVAPMVPEHSTPELIEVVSEVRMARRPPPPIQPPRDVVPDRPPPDARTPEVPMAPPPPVVARAPVPRLAQPSPARELPKRGGPPTTFEDAMVARVPPLAQNRQDSPPSAAPDTRSREQSVPQASLPRMTDARYGQNPTPPYPPEARRRGWEGTVLLVVEILENGRPERISIKQSSGHRTLDEAALGAVGRWRFIPAQRDGKPVKSFAEVPIIFSLRNGR